MPAARLGKKGVFTIAGVIVVIVVAVVIGFSLRGRVELYVYTIDQKTGKEKPVRNGEIARQEVEVTFATKSEGVKIRIEHKDLQGTPSEPRVTSVVPYPLSRIGEYSIRVVMPDGKVWKPFTFSIYARSPVFTIRNVENDKSYDTPITPMVRVQHKGSYRVFLEWAHTNRWDNRTGRKEEFSDTWWKRFDVQGQYILQPLVEDRRGNVISHEGIQEIKFRIEYPNPTIKFEKISDRVVEEISDMDLFSRSLSARVSVSNPGNPYISGTVIIKKDAKLIRTDTISAEGYSKDRFFGRSGTYQIEVTLSEKDTLSRRDMELFSEERTFKIEYPAPDIRASVHDGYTYSRPVELSIELKRHDNDDVGEMRVSLTRDGTPVFSEDLSSQSKIQRRITKSGRYLLSARVLDQEGREMTPPGKRTWSFDIDTPPKIVFRGVVQGDTYWIAPKSPEPKYRLPLSLGIDISDGRDAFETLTDRVCTVTGPSMQKTSEIDADFSRELQEFGTYHISAQAKDSAGNLAREAIDFTIKEDKPPVIKDVQVKGKRVGKRQDMFYEAIVVTVVCVDDRGGIKSDSTSCSDYEETSEDRHLMVSFNLEKATGDTVKEEEVNLTAIFSDITGQTVPLNRSFTLRRSQTQVQWPGKPRKVEIPDSPTIVTE